MENRLQHGASSKHQCPGVPVPSIVTTTAGPEKDPPPKKPCHSLSRIQNGLLLGILFQVPASSMREHGKNNVASALKASKDSL